MMKRIKRDELVKKNINLEEPFDFSKFGSEDDPCFGKLYSPSAAECKRCGDSELCIIMQGQTNHIKRDSIEKKQPFKDIQKLKVKSSVIYSTLNKIVKEAKKVTLEEARKLICKELNCSTKHFDLKLPLVQDKIKSANKITFKNNTFIYGK